MSLLSYDSARSLLASAIQPLAAQTCALQDAAGCVLSQDVRSDMDLPPFAASAMDGYAARSAELVGDHTLPVAFEVAAGQVPLSLPRGQVARIFTGAPLPKGADCVVMQEDAQVHDDGRVELNSVAPDTNVRAAGEIAVEGQALATAGQMVTPVTLAALAAGGAAHVSVRPRPATSIVLTGSELVTVDKKPGPGQIRDSNRYLLQALSLQAGSACNGVELATDELDGIIASIDRAVHRADVVLCSGGVSVGDHDYVPQAVQDLGGKVLLHGVAMKPGKPLLIARIRDSWLVGLPGNPVSVLAGFYLFVRPLLDGLAGEAQAFVDHSIPVEVSEELRNNGKRTLFLPGVLSRQDGHNTVSAVDWQGSHDIVAAAKSSCLIRIEPSIVFVKGSRVPCLDYYRALS